MELSPALPIEKLSTTGGPTTPSIRVGIVGCGSRGLTVLERLCALAGDIGRQVEISVFDPQTPGPGLHSVDQPDYLMLNTVASQISMFPDPAALAGLAGRRGPNFYEWCLRYKSAERNVKPNEFLPRRWLGEYLSWTYAQVIRDLADNVTVSHHACVVDNVEHTDLGGFILSTESGGKHPVDWLLITVGHSQPAPNVENSSDSDVTVLGYPQLHALGNISSTEAIAIQGLGLSAMDAVAELTVGRGGRFVHGPQGLEYLPSGHEPRLFLYSRTGLPYRTRPDVAAHRVNPPALIFTLSAVAALRADHPEGLDFEAQVLPLIKAEMLAEYFGMFASLKGESPQRIKSEIAHAFLLGDLDKRARELAARFSVPSLDEAVYNPNFQRAPVENYGAWMRGFIERDIAESIADLDHSPVKAAAEVWRSCREQIRRVVDNGGLKPESHRIFFSEYAPLVNRMVAGPQKERHQELLALSNAGLIEWVHCAQVIHNEAAGVTLVELGSGERAKLTLVIKAHVSSNSSAETQPAVIRQLRENGIIHSLDDSGNGIHVDSHGRALPNLWITGPVVEGATYYNHYVPSAGSYSRAFIDADRIAREMLGVHVQAGVVA